MKILTLCSEALKKKKEIIYSSLNLSFVLFPRARAQKLEFSYFLSEIELNCKQPKLKDTKTLRSYPSIEEAQHGGVNKYVMHGNSVKLRPSI